MGEQESRSPDEATPGDEGQQEDHLKHAGNGAGGTLAEDVMQAIREAALEVLGPATRHATTAAAKYAVSMGPELVAKHVMPAVRSAGGPGVLADQVSAKAAEALSGVGGIAGLAGKVLSKRGREGTGGDPSGWGRNRRMPVQQTIYVSVPVKQAYNGWTEYKQWPRYMHRVNLADTQVTDKEARVKVTEKMWGFKRPFTAQVLTQRPDEHIKWRSTEGSKHTGVINFHELGPRLTLIEVNVDHSPSGPVEKFARGARYVKRAVRADFHRFQGWIEMKSDDELADLEGWRGTIAEGQIVTSHEDALEDERRAEEGEQQEPERASEEAPEPAKEQAPEPGEEQVPQAGTEKEPEGAGQDEFAAWWRQGR
jgi:uncharacterized membrane protein